MKVKCPTCKKESEFSKENSAKPFCSERCKLTDLGAWASEDYGLESTEPLSEEDLEQVLSSQEESEKH